VRTEPQSKLVSDRVAGSKREIQRRYRVGPAVVDQAIREGVPAARLHHRRFTILFSDFETWLRSKRIPITTHAQAVVDAVLERERRAG